MDLGECYGFEDGFACMKTVGILEVDETVDIDKLLEQVQQLATAFRHPLLVPIVLLFRDIQETTKQFMGIERLLGEVEDQMSTTNRGAEEFSQTDKLEDADENTTIHTIEEKLYQCSKLFARLERRFDFEERFGDKILKAICWGYKRCRVTHDNERPLVSWFADINRLYRTARLAGRVQATLEESQARSRDMKRIPDRIKSLQKLVSLPESSTLLVTKSDYLSTETYSRSRGAGKWSS